MQNSNSSPASLAHPSPKSSRYGLGSSKPPVPPTIEDTSAPPILKPWIVPWASKSGYARKYSTR